MYTKFARNYQMHILVLHTIFGCVSHSSTAGFKINKLLPKCLSMFFFACLCAQAHMFVLFLFYSVYVSGCFDLETPDLVRFFWRNWNWARAPKNMKFQLHHLTFKYCRQTDPLAFTFTLYVVWYHWGMCVKACLVNMLDGFHFKVFNQTNKFSEREKMQKKIMSHVRSEFVVLFFLQHLNETIQFQLYKDFFFFLLLFFSRTLAFT